jgi:hypothetical protein
VRKEEVSSRKKAQDAQKEAEDEKELSHYSYFCAFCAFFAATNLFFTSAKSASLSL